MSRFARPYAQAYLETVPPGYDVEGFLSAAGLIVRAMSGDARLKNFLAGPSVPPDAKRRVLDDLTARAGVDDTGRKFLGLVLANRRIADLAPILSAIRALWDRNMGVVEARVTVAAPLGADEEKRIQEALARQSGRRVRMKVDVDRNILAGFVARLGSEIFDASAMRAIERFQDKAASE
ncbi:MAG TPA: ATP synthase F1 subunit delta [Thermoanaerobaculia bacterium]